MLFIHTDTNFFCQTNKREGKKNSSWLLGCFGFNGPLRQYFSLYRAVSQGEKEERKNR